MGQNKANRALPASLNAAKLLCLMTSLLWDSGKDTPGGPVYTVQVLLDDGEQFAVARDLLAGAIHLPNGVPVQAFELLLHLTKALQPASSGITSCTKAKNSIREVYLTAPEKTTWLAGLDLKSPRVQASCKAVGTHTFCCMPMISVMCSSLTNDDIVFTVLEVPSKTLCTLS